VGKGNPLALLRQVTPMLRRMVDDTLTASAGAEPVIYHPKALGGYSIAEKLGIPGILALPLPLYSPTVAFPSPIIPMASLGPILNRLSHRAMITLTSASVHGVAAAVEVIERVARYSDGVSQSAIARADNAVSR
jgi:sterol 3beta-glucosyltransferase